MEPLFTYQRAGLRFEVWPNRVEVKDTSGFGAKLTGGKTTTLPVRQIANVEIAGLTRKLKITTSDNKTHEYMLGTQSEQARQVILSIL